MSTDAQLSLDERFALVRSVGEECIQEDELRNLLEKKPNIRCYDGFEPSGRMHIAQGIFKSVNVNKCTTSGCEFVFWVADWFALMNDKVGGELSRIKVVGEYLIEVWKAAGMDMSKVVFLWSSNDITDHADTYWRVVLDIGRRNTIARIKKCCTIMGKTEGTLTAAQVLYPLMQCSDIFYLKADICQLGLDQRKVNMLAREYCDLTKRKLKPVILSHHMLAGLKQGQAKMSKSDPDSAIFMEDSAEDVARKIRQAYCPRVAQVTTAVNDDGAPVSTDDKNPVLDYYQCIIFARPGARATVNGRTFESYHDLEAAFLSEEISEEALKEGLIDEINRLLDPVRLHFDNDSTAKALLEQVKSFRKDGAAPAITHAEAPAVSATPSALMWLPPVMKLSLELAATIVDSARQFLSEHADGSVTLVLADLTAFASDALTGEEADIKAAMTYNTELLRAAGLPKEVTAVYESELMLNHRTDFWVTVINVGRQNTLTHIEELYGGEVKNAGQVIAALMRVACAATLRASHVIRLTTDGRLNELVTEFTKGAVQIAEASAVHIPALHKPGAPPAVFSGDETLFLDDTDLDLRRKIKKAYAAPEEGENPVVDLALYLMKNQNGELVVERSEANGGNLTFNAEAPLRAACQEGKLHPADLKATVSKLLLATSEETRKQLTQPKLKELSQALKKVEKKLSKKK